MEKAFDLVVRGGTVVDGTGAQAFEADVGVKDGRIAAVGRIAGSGAEEIDARGQVVIPGFVDIHTHYDGQATWDQRMQPSSWHGVTTTVFGNCGVGFAPVRPGHSGYLINLMEGVEDIPGSVLSEGVKFDWESFPQFLDALASMPRAVDVAAQLPHGALRFYVMGERGADHAERPDQGEREEMTRLVEEALRGGVIRELAGFDGLRREVRYGVENSRIDFCLDFAGEAVYVEVKSVTLGYAGEAVAAFPDARTERGARHLRELAALARSGIRAVQLYCVNLSGIEAVRAAEEIDPAYAAALREAKRAGVEVLAYGAELTPDSISLVRQLEVL